MVGVGIRTGDGSCAHTACCAGLAPATSGGPSWPAVAQAVGRARTQPSTPAHDRVTRGIPGHAGPSAIPTTVRWATTRPSSAHRTALRGSDKRVGPPCRPRTAPRPRSRTGTGARRPPGWPDAAPAARAPVGGSPARRTPPPQRWDHERGPATQHAGVVPADAPQLARAVERGDCTRPGHTAVGGAGSVRDAGRGRRRSIHLPTYASRPQCSATPGAV